MGTKPVKGKDPESEVSSRYPTKGPMKILDFKSPDSRIDMFLLIDFNKQDTSGFSIFKSTYITVNLFFYGEKDSLRENYLT